VPMYIAGARMESMYPLSILTAGMGVNFTCISYRDNMDFGIIVDPDLLPHSDTIPPRLEAALAEYTALCKPRRKNRKQSTVKTKEKTKAKTRRGKSAGTTVKKPAPKRKQP
jgi:diacylglycerol O-acyltransferase